MFKRYKKQLILSSLVILLPIVFGLLMWNKLPDTIATHWGAGGEADGWSSKGFAIFFTPVFLLLMHLFCVWITDLTNRSTEQNPKVLNLTFWLMPIVSLLSNGMVYAIAFGKVWTVSAFMPFGMGLMFLIIGNILPKCRKNTTIGIKVVWALRNEENWYATHRFAGKTWVAGGLIAFFSGFLPEEIGYPVMFIALLGTAFSSVLYSYLYYRKQLKNGTAVPVRDVPVDKTTRLVRRIGWTVTIVILVGVVIMLFTGSIEYQFREDALVMDATFFAPLTIRYENIEAIEYREGDVDGSRSGGYGSFRLLLGFFENQEFGMYNRYTCYKPDGCIVVTTRGNTIVLSGMTGEETQEIYNTLLTKMK